MICKICAQKISDPGKAGGNRTEAIENAQQRRRLKDYTDEQYQAHLIADHGYDAPEVPPPPPLTNQELTDQAQLAWNRLVAWREEFAVDMESVKSRLDAVEKKNEPAPQQPPPPEHERRNNP